MTTATSSPGLAVPASALAAMDADDFDALIRASIGIRDNPAVWDALTDPAVITRTRTVLAALHTDVQNQLNLANVSLQQAKDDGYAMGEEGKQSYFAARTEQNEWRRKAIGFRRLVEQRLAFVKSRAVRPEQRPTGSKNVRRHNWEALEKLARAVASHRDKVLSGQGGEDDDDTLWDSLDKITALTQTAGEMPLADWLEWLEDVRAEGED